MVYTKDNFPVMKTVPNRPLTYIAWFLLGLLSLTLLACLLLIPLAFQLEHEGKMNGGKITFDIIYYALSFWGIWAIYKYYKRTKNEKIEYITVDKNGIHYHSYNGKVEHILYKQLQKSNEYYSNDIDRTVGTRYSPGYIYGFIEEKKSRIDFYTRGNGMLFIPKNKYQLIGHFLQGVHLFCPKLRISEAIFVEYYVDKESYEYNEKNYWITNFLIFAAIIVVFLLIDLVIYFTKGYSLIF